MVEVNGVLPAILLLQWLLKRFIDMFIELIMALAALGFLAGIALVVFLILFKDTI
jgi:hypothetical protein